MIWSPPSSHLLAPLCARSTRCRSAGGNAVENVVHAGLQGVEFVVANTDGQALALNPAETRIQLGLKITQGLGAGSRPGIGRAAAEDTMEQLEGALDGAHKIGRASCRERVCQ